MARMVRATPVMDLFVIAAMLAIGIFIGSGIHGRDPGDQRSQQQTEQEKECPSGNEDCVLLFERLVIAGEKIRLLEWEKLVLIRQAFGKCLRRSESFISIDSDRCHKAIMVGCPLRFDAVGVSHLNRHGEWDSHNSDHQRDLRDIARTFLLGHPSDEDRATEEPAKGLGGNVEAFHFLKSPGVFCGCLAAPAYRRVGFAILETAG